MAPKGYQRHISLHIHHHVRHGQHRVVRDERQPLSEEESEDEARRALETGKLVRGKFYTVQKERLRSQPLFVLFEGEVRL